MAPPPEAQHAQPSHTQPPAPAPDAKPDEGEKDADAMKGHDFTCLQCGNDLDDDEKYCPECGTQNPGYEGLNMKAGKPTPGAGVAGSAASDIEPVPSHREPDGVAIEEFESDAGLPTTPDSSVKAAQRLHALGVPTDLGQLHDALCPAFHPKAVDGAYPHWSPKSIDTAFFQNAALDAVSNGSFEDATKAADIWRHAETLKSTDTAVLNGLREEFYKNFKDANPGPGSFPQPTEISPKKFNRGYITAGTAKPGADYKGPNTHAVPAPGGISASDYTRGPLTAGQADDSPANKGIPYPTQTGKPERIYYESTMKDAAASAMASMHDHISQTFPDLCSLHAPGVNGALAEGTRPVPVAKSEEPVQNSPEATQAPEVSTKGKKKVKKAKHVAKAAGMATEVADSADLFKMIEGLTSQVQALTEQNAILAKAVDALGDQPDPSETPFRGVAHKGAGMHMAPAAASTASAAEATQALVMRELEEHYRTTPDPGQREAAWRAITKMRGL
jgi:hypothetical protein